MRPHPFALTYNTARLLMMGNGGDAGETYWSSPNGTFGLSQRSSILGSSCWNQPPGFRNLYICEYSFGQSLIPPVFLSLAEFPNYQDVKTDRGGILYG